MKKILSLIFAVLILTGCSATANINIDKDKITESIDVQASNDEEYNELKNWNGFPLPLYYDQQLENPFGSDREEESGVDYYKVEFNNSNKKIIGYGEFSIKNHTKSSIVRNCFKFYNITKGDTIREFSTSSGLICDFSNFTIAVKTPYKVISNNAQNVDTENNIYTWKVNSSNKNSIYLQIEIDFSQKYNEQPKTEINDPSPEETKTQEEKEDNNFLTILLIIGAGLLLLIALFMILLMKKKKVSEI